MFGPAFASTNLECPDAKKDQKGMPLQHQNCGSFCLKNIFFRLWQQWLALSPAWKLPVHSVSRSSACFGSSSLTAGSNIFWTYCWDLMAVALTGLRGWAVTKSRATPNPVMLLQGNFKLPHALTLFFPLAQYSMIGSWEGSALLWPSQSVSCRPRSLLTVPSPLPHPPLQPVWQLQ